MSGKLVHFELPAQDAARARTDFSLVQSDASVSA